MAKATAIWNILQQQQQTNHSTPNNPAAKICLSHFTALNTDDTPTFIDSATAPKD